MKKAYIRGVECMMQLGELREARKLLEKGLSKYPKDKDLNQQDSKLTIIKQKMERIYDKLNINQNNDNNNEQKTEEDVLSEAAQQKRFNDAQIAIR